MDSLIPYSLTISELFSTASASATIFNLKAKLYEETTSFWHDDRLRITSKERVIVRDRILNSGDV